jgi:hypothetical protein
MSIFRNLNIINQISYILNTNNINIKKYLKIIYTSLTLNYEYKLNLYFLICLFICILSSIIIRCHILDILTISTSNIIILIIRDLLIFFTIVYSIKLIFGSAGVIKRCIQSFKIIPEYIKWKKEGYKNMTSIIVIYYILNIFFMIISIVILYNILLKLNLFIENIYLYIIIGGVLFSLVFMYYYPLKDFNFNNNTKTYSIWVYCLLFIFFIFYIFIIPLIIINIINSEKYILFKEMIINKYVNSNTELK